MAQALQPCRLRCFHKPSLLAELSDVALREWLLVRPEITVDHQLRPPLFLFGGYLIGDGPLVHNGADIAHEIGGNHDH